jgi:hypothetical protein
LLVLSIELVGLRQLVLEHLNIADLHISSLACLEEPVTLVVHLVPHLVDLGAELPVVVVE